MDNLTRDEKHHLNEFARLTSNNPQVHEKQLLKLYLVLVGEKEGACLTAEREFLSQWMDDQNNYTRAIKRRLKRRVKIHLGLRKTMEGERDDAYSFLRETLESLDGVNFLESHSRFEITKSSEKLQDIREEKVKESHEMWGNFYGYPEKSIGVMPSREERKEVVESSDKLDWDHLLECETFVYYSPAPTEAEIQRLISTAKKRYRIIQQETCQIDSSEYRYLVRQLEEFLDRNRAVLRGP